MLRPGCKEYFWLLCKLIDNIHVKDASQVGLLCIHASVYCFSFVSSDICSSHLMGWEQLLDVFHLPLYSVLSSSWKFQAVTL